MFSREHYLDSTTRARRSACSSSTLADAWKLSSTSISLGATRSRQLAVCEYTQGSALRPGTGSVYGSLLPPLRREILAKGQEDRRHRRGTAIALWVQSTRVRRAIDHSLAEPV